MTPDCKTQSLDSIRGTDDGNTVPAWNHHDALFIEVITRCKSDYFAGLLPAATTGTPGPPERAAAEFDADEERRDKEGPCEIDFEVPTPTLAALGLVLLLKGANEPFGEDAAPVLTVLLAVPFVGDAFDGIPFAVSGLVGDFAPGSGEGLNERWGESVDATKGARSGQEEERDVFEVFGDAAPCGMTVDVLDGNRDWPLKDPGLAFAALPDAAALPAGSGLRIQG